MGSHVGGGVSERYFLLGLYEYRHSDVNFEKDSVRTTINLLYPIPSCRIRYIMSQFKILFEPFHQPPGNVTIRFEWLLSADPPVLLDA